MLWVYVMGAQVLLVNLLIAMMNRTYEKYYEEASTEHKLITVKKLFEVEPLLAAPPPLTLLLLLNPMVLLRLVRWACCCCLGRGDGRGSPGGAPAPAGSRASIARRDDHLSRAEESRRRAAGWRSWRPARAAPAG